MHKHARHAAIREIVREGRYASQEELREALAEKHFDVTQATLSRDIRELRLLKVPDADGGAYYTLPPEAWDQTPRLERLLSSLYVGAEGTGNLLVLKTLAGGAQPVAVALDWEEWPEVVGTIAGDDTILVIARGGRGAAALVKRLKEYTEA